MHQENLITYLGKFYMKPKKSIIIENQEYLFYIVDKEFIANDTFPLLVGFTQENENSSFEFVGYPATMISELNTKYENCTKILVYEKIPIDHSQANNIINKLNNSKDRIV